MRDDGGEGKGRRDGRREGRGDGGDGRRVINDEGDEGDGGMRKRGERVGWMEGVISYSLLSDRIQQMVCGLSHGLL